MDQRVFFKEIREMLRLNDVEKGEMLLYLVSFVALSIACVLYIL